MKKIVALMLSAIMLFVLCACGNSTSTTTEEEWTCNACGKTATGQYCSNCGAAKPVETEAANPTATEEEWTCNTCGKAATGLFCSNCGAAKPVETEVADPTDNLSDKEEINDATDVPSVETTPESTVSIIHNSETIKTSPDKYTWYVQDYVGRNAASIGYTSMGGDRFDRYGSSLLRIIYVADDGTYVDIDDDDILKQFIVTGQSLSPNTEIKLTFQTDSDGNEYSSLIDHQSYESIDLTVSRINGVMYNDKVEYEVTEISPSPDKYTVFVENYVGKNLLSFGYTSWGGNRMIKLGNAYIELILIPSDGAYLDVDDTSLLSSYVVTGQDVQPNTQVNLVYMRDSDGEEYDSLIENQSVEKIALNLRKINTPPVEIKEED